MSGRQVQRQGVDPRNQFGPKGIMHGPVTRDACHVAQLSRFHTHAKVTLSAFLITGVTYMFLAFVKHLNLLGCNTGIQLALLPPCRRRQKKRSETSE